MVDPGVSRKFSQESNDMYKNNMKVEIYQVV